MSMEEMFAKILYSHRRCNDSRVGFMKSGVMLPIETVTTVIYSTRHCCDPVSVNRSGHLLPTGCFFLLPCASNR